MTFQYTAHGGQPTVLSNLAKDGVPPLTDYSYPTNAPYDARAAQSTLLLNRLQGAYVPHPAVTTVTHKPGISLHVRSALDNPAQYLLIGDTFGGPLKAYSDIGSICVLGTMDETHVSFIGVSGQVGDFVQIENMSAQKAATAAGGLFVAAETKLVKLLTGKQAPHLLTRK